MTDKKSERLADNRLTSIFQQLCDAVGFEVANKLYDSRGLNSDWPKTEADVEIAEGLLGKWL